MTIAYKYVESTVKPPLVEIVDTKVYIRKGLTRTEKRTEGQSDIFYWTYQEAQITLEEYNLYRNILITENALKAIDDSENIQKLKENQQNVDENQLAIMEAIADLYEMIATLGLN